MSAKMSKAPIFFAASQVTFNEIREMEKYVDAIQERMRGLKFVDFSRTDLKSLQLNAVSPEIGIQQTQTVRWQFVNFEKTSGYSLMPNMLFFQTTAYETSDELRSALLEGLALIHEIVGLSYIQSIGLRTLDAIVPQQNEDISNYLKPNLMGFSQSFEEGVLRHSMSETVTQKEGGILISRAVILGPETPSIGVPFDLYPIQLKFVDRFQTVKGTHAILDNDRVHQDRFEYDLKEVEKRFIAIKKDVKEAFFAAITDKARESWK